MDIEQQAQRQWIEEIQRRYSQIQAKYTQCTERSTASQLAVEMRLLEAAILGIERGAKHGTCISCKAVIPEERLRVLHWTIWCIACAEQQNPETRSLEELLFPLK